MKTFEKSSVLTCTIDQLFNFHVNLENLPNITPKGVHASLMHDPFTPKEGDIIKIYTKKSFIPMVWEVKIEKLVSPTLLVDLALKSPFKYWKHSHIFHDLGNGQCELKDVVEYEAPLGFIGKWFDFIVRRELQSMFDHRHEVTKKMLTFSD